MGRELLLSGLAGVATGSTGTYLLHRALWKSSDDQARRIEGLLRGPQDGKVSAGGLRRSLTEEPARRTLEQYWGQRTAQTWNTFVDSVHGCFLNLPKTAAQMVDDAKSSIGISREGNEAPQADKEG